MLSVKSLELAINLHPDRSRGRGCRIGGLFGTCSIALVAGALVASGSRVFPSRAADHHQILAVALHS